MKGLEIVTKLAMSPVNPGFGDMDALNYNFGPSHRVARDMRKDVALCPLILVSHFLVPRVVRAR